MKLIITMLSLVAVLNAETVEVVADKFFADEVKQVTEFTGHVIVTKAKDKLVANKVVINFDEKRQPLKYIATGNVKVDLMIAAANATTPKSSNKVCSFLKNI